MKKTLSAFALSFAVAGGAFAGGFDEPEMEKEIIIEETETSSSSAGVIIPLIALLLIVAVASAD
ncbi:hypothetical protein [Parasulfitobacter algicola]|uniref:Ferrochelatase n=1 Tax=Parasulfitobacter algicola TaxID=2614809 RepID=A0ABX2IUA2_9RHOB|nr:hypothetical protein [Sulfitobacter algicola]NSX56478.1 hypothetical protein [Sulfitobacter algicola]